jgi:hypothetical protein
MTAWFFAVKYGCVEMEKVLYKWLEFTIYMRLKEPNGLIEFINQGVPLKVLSDLVSPAAEEYASGLRDDCEIEEDFRAKGMMCTDCGELKPRRDEHETTDTEIVDDVPLW